MINLPKKKPFVNDVINFKNLGSAKRKLALLEGFKSTCFQNSNQNVQDTFQFNIFFCHKYDFLGEFYLSILPDFENREPASV